MSNTYTPNSNPQNPDPSWKPDSVSVLPSKTLSLPRGDRASGSKKKLSLTLSQKSHDIIENYVETYNHRSASDALDAILSWIVENVDSDFGKARPFAGKKTRGRRPQKPQSES